MIQVCNNTYAAQGRHQLQQKFPTWKEITAEALRNLAGIVELPEKELVASRVTGDSADSCGTRCLN